jgi:O-antigen/teichoic acid export membrane protein
VLVERFNQFRIAFLRDTLGASLLRGFAGSGAVQGVGMLFTFLVGIQLARGLGAASYGRYGIALAVLTVMTVPATLGIPKLIVREVAAALSWRDLPKLYGVLRWGDKICLAASLAISVILAGVAWIVSAHSERLALAILFGIPSVSLMALANIRSSALQGLHHVVSGQVPLFLLRPLLFSIGLFWLFRVMPHAASRHAMALNVVTALITLIVSEMWLRRRLPKPKPVSLSITGASWIRSSLPMALTDGLQILQGQLSIIVLGALAPADEVGLFRIGVSISSAIGVATTLVALAAGPTLARLHSERDLRLQKVLTHAAQLQFVLVAAVALPLSLFAEPLLRVVFGSEYSAATPALVILLIGQIANSAFGVNNQLLNMTGHERSLTKATLFGLIVNVTVTAALAIRMGAIAAAIGATLSMFVWNGMATVAALRRMNVNTSVLPVRTIQSLVAFRSHLKAVEGRLPLTLQRHIVSVVGRNPYTVENDRTQSIFVHIPKTAGTSILRAVYGVEWGPHAPLSRYAAFDRDRFNRYFKFAFVRNPWDRLLSGFSFLRFDPNLPPADRNWAARHLDVYPDFHAFVSDLENPAIRRQIVSHYIFRLQVDWLRMPGSSDLALDFLGRFENLQKDFAVIAERLNIAPHLPIMRPSRRGPYREAYTESTRRIAAQIYASDIHAFGYDF